jgi:hypothetical protein
MQVADFGETDNEWQVERILSHVSHGDATTFEVKWTSGDTTWLPADQVAHLSVLTDYLDRRPTVKLRRDVPWRQ